MTQRLVRLLVSWLIALGLASVAGAASAHHLDSASLTLTEVAEGRFLMRWRAASNALEEDLRAPAVFPAPCRLDRATLDCGASGLVGSIEFPWLEGTLTRVMVDIRWQNGQHLLRVVSPSAPSLKVYGVPAGVGLGSLSPIVADYVGLGIEHILTGFDHLLFVMALVFLVGSVRSLVATITAFTLAHSLSLAATVLGVVQPPAPPVEAAIALSIVLVCAECLHPEGSLTRRAPWLVAFTFGLLHGLGFASALLEIGLPQEHLPIALFSFNVGVELGQLGVIALALLLRRLGRRGPFRSPWLARGLVTAMGATAAYWLIARLPAVFGL